jgi:hypothetical protein
MKYKMIIKITIRITLTSKSPFFILLVLASATIGFLGSASG